MARSKLTYPLQMVLTSSCEVLCGLLLALSRPQNPTCTAGSFDSPADAKWQSTSHLAEHNLCLGCQPTGKWAADSATRIQLPVHSRERHCTQGPRNLLPRTQKGEAFCKSWPVVLWGPP